jgi:integrase
MSIARIYKYMETMRRLVRRCKKPLLKLTKKDIKELVIRIESDPKLSDWSKHDLKVTIKKLYKWHKGKNEIYPEEVRWISVRVRDKYKLPEELLTEEEIKKMIEGCSDARDRALVHILYETGCRIGEILTLQIKNIKFDDFGAVILVNGKTGPRRVRIVASVSSLATWLELHPFKERTESYLFIRRVFGKEKNPVPFRYEYAARVIKNLARKVGIKKRVHLHLFRHSRATALANKLTEAQMKEYFGWVQASHMASIYVHLSGRDVDDAILGMYNLKDTKKEEEKFKPVSCPRCTHSNSPGSKFCIKCGFAMDSDFASYKENKEMMSSDLLNALMKDPHFQEIIAKKLMEKNNSSLDGGGKSYGQ